MSAPEPLDRRLSLLGAVAIGVGSMLGAGVFVVLGPAAAAAGPWLAGALVLAAVVALLNARATAQLAAQHPVAGGVHAYARAELGPRWGFVAGWAFLVGKVGSCAAMALVAATYLLGSDGTWRTVLAVALVVAVTTLNCLGVERTATAAVVLAALTLLVLALVVTVALTGPSHAPEDPAMPSARGVLQASALLFFAFAGYARIATLGEEVVDPARTIPRAVDRSLLLVLVVYVAVTVAVLHALGIKVLAGSTQPLADAVVAAGAGWAEPVVRVGAASASLGALLALSAGLGRTSFAMARVGDLPRWAAHVHPTRRVPQRAELATSTVVVVIVLVGEVQHAIALSSFAVLLYYGVAHVSAWRQTPPRRLLPRWLDVVGVTACAVLALSLPGGDVLVAGGAVLGGLLVREVVRQRADRTP
ncbi:hypothetical protein ASD11_11875 [Aeromicrobium sp. Root495]|uniref:APC family permease n=1 Tax=Aeromicrobium sp. Root495 TaxID=1736550 RepID=UPI0006FBCD06|nr:APC family permease [Aeromicrobium sp. Root495]KQY60794.1 hypothetical protein ASD11_11875 [Aeromicrobium sp. Root495]